MKKASIALIITILFFTKANCQLDKGNWLVGGSGSFYLNSYKNSDGTVSTIDISPNIGYFMFDKIAGGLKLSYTRRSDKATDIYGQENYHRTIAYGFGPFVRYYFLPVEKQYNILIEANYLHRIEKTNGNNFNSSQNSANKFSIAGGPVIYFNSSVGLEFLIGYSTYRNKKQPGGNYNTIQCSIGLQVHLEKNK